MGYRIVYGKKKTRFHSLSKRSKILIIAIVGCILLMAVSYFGGAEVYLPGDREVTGVALENMVDSLQDGEKLSDAITAFCREIIENAQTPQ